MIAIPKFMSVARELRRALALTLALPALAFAATGEAVFVSGDVRLIQANGTQRSLVVGERIQAGESLQASANGYAHLRFPDGGFVGVRPGSRFVLEDYATDAAAPGGVRVRYRLDNGAVRAITGQTVEQHKNRFRLNTPVAAVGVRGTDYVVQASENLTRASVNRGAIVMAPLGAGCEAAALGACDTPEARTLTAAQGGAYLEYRAGTQAPELKTVAPPGLAPAAPDEPASTPGKRVESSVGTVDTTVAATANRIDAVVSALPPALSPALPDQPTLPPALPDQPTLPARPPEPVQPPPPPPPSEVVWGRWSSIAAATPTTVEQSAKGYSPWFSSVVFGLLVREMVTDMPRQGVVGFSLTGSEAYVREGANLSPVTVQDATLTVDFGARRFDTSLSVNGAGVSSQLSASGKVDWQGAMISEASRSTMQVLGMLGGATARDAGYLFEKPLNAGAAIYGATSWRR